MDSLDKIQHILRTATVILCPSLQPAKVLRRLKAEGELTSGDVADIQYCVRVDDQVDKLLETLCLKPESAYVAFINALEIEREDLFWDVKDIQKTHNYVPGVRHRTSNTTRSRLCSDTWEAAQIRTFTKWCNKYLQRVNQHINNIKTDLSDGLKLFALVQVLAQKEITGNRRKPTTRVYQLENVSLVLRFLQNENVNLVGIGSEDIVDSNKTMTLGLVWQLIQHYHDYSDDENIGCRGQQKKTTSLKEKLLIWLRDTLPTLDLSNFKTNWTDGRALGALVNAHSSELCEDWADWRSCDAMANITEAMNLADTWLHVNQLIRADDMVSPAVDENSLLTYLSQFYSCNVQEVPSKPGKPTITDINERSLSVAWSKPNYVGKSPHTGYTVEYIDSGNSFWEGCQDIRDTWFTIVGLDHYQQYQVRLRAMYEAGQGPTGTPSNICTTRPKLQMDEIQTILYRITAILCKFLDPSRVLIILKTKLVLTDDDEREIKSHPSIEKRVNQMLILLKQKSNEAYFALMEALRVERHDLFQEVINIESEIITGSQIAYTSPFTQQPEIISHDEDGEEVTSFRYYDDTLAQKTIDSTSRKTTAAVTDIKIEIESVQQTSPKTFDQTSRFDKSIYKAISKSQILSNLVNNVFKPKGCKLVKLVTRPLRFSVQCRGVYHLEKTREICKDGTLAKKIENVLLTDEIIDGEDPSQLRIKTEMDEETYRRAHGSFAESVLGTPGQPHVTSENRNSITLSWTHPPDAKTEVSGYNMDYKEGYSTLWIRANKKLIPETTFRVTGLDWTAAYHFRVFAMYMKTHQGPPSETSAAHHCSTGEWSVKETFGKNLKALRGIALCPDEEVVLADFDKGNFQVYDSNRKKKLKFSTKQWWNVGSVSRPWEVVVSYTGTFLVTDRDSPYVHVFSTDGSHQSQFATVTPQGGITSYASDDNDAVLRGIALSDTGHVWVGVIGPYCYISKHNREGKHISSIHLTTPPMNIAMASHNDEIVISDHSTVQIIDKTGSVMHSLNPPDVRRWSPRGVCCIKDTICIANHANWTSDSSGAGIYFYSMSGHYLGYIGNGQLDYPTCISMTQDGEKMFVTTENKGVNVLTRE